MQIPDAYLPRRASGGRLTMGLRPLAEGAWLEVDADRGVELAMKAELLDSAFATCVAVLPGSEAAGRELLGAVVDDLTRHHADLELDLAAFEVHASSAVAADHGVVAASRLVQEDLCLLDASGVLVAACVCFPSRWVLAEKLGELPSAVHRSVPGYAEQLGAPTDSALARLTAVKSVWRLNWTILDTDALHLPSPAARRAPVPAAPQDLVLRCERQTLRRLPETEAICFTIRTYRTALPEAIAGRPEVAAALASTLDEAPEALLAYKGWTAFAEDLRAYLHRCAEGAS